MQEGNDSLAVLNIICHSFQYLYRKPGKAKPWCKCANFESQADWILPHYQNEHHKLEVVLNGANQKAQLGPSQTINVFRVRQEAINNAVKYGQFSLLTIQASYQNEELHIVLKDNGVGFTADAQSQRGYGLTNMEVRMQEVKGSLRVQSALNKGTEITLRLRLNTPFYV